MYRLTLFSILICLGLQECISHHPQNGLEDLSDAEFTAYLQSLTDSLKQADYKVSFTKKLGPQACEADLHILKYILEEAQTTIYRFSSKVKVDSAFDYSFKAAKDSLTYIELVRHIARIQNVIACGHSGWGHSQAYRQYRNKELRFFPLDLKISGDRYFVDHNNSLDTAIQRYSEVTYINNEPVEDISARLKKYMYKDGTGRQGNTDLENFFGMAYSNFLANPAEFRVKLKNRNGTSDEYTLRALPGKEIDSLKLARYGFSPPQKPLRFYRIDSLNTAVFTIERFNNEYIHHFDQDFEKFTDSVFDVLNDTKTTNLIVDIRGDVGGWTGNGTYLFSYFIDHPVPYIKEVEVKKYHDFSFQPIMTSTSEYVDTMDMQMNSRGLYSWKNYPSLMAIPPDQNRFKGKVYILINDYSRSCSSIFASLMKEHTMALLVGSETGSAKCGAGGMVLSVELPYSGISIYFSTAKYTSAVKDSLTTHGVRPDLEIHPDWQSIISDKDKVRDSVLQLIAKY